MPNIVVAEILAKEGARSTRSSILVGYTGRLGYPGYVEAPMSDVARLI
jgi:hypothetical protein